MKKIKICGLRDKQATKAADWADYAGFVVGSPKSRRNISLNRFKALKSLLDHAQPILVTVNADLKFLHRLSTFEDTIIQLHGSARQFFQLVPRLAIGLSHQEISNRLTFEYSNCDYLSVDSLNDDGYGGTGETWNWKNYKNGGKWTTLIAGGISIDNVDDAFSKTGADGVDVSSGVEKDGKKSPKLIHQLIDHVRGY